MLYGMADPIKDSALVAWAVRASASTRPTANCCRAWPTWCAARLLENTANTSFLRASFTEHTRVEPSFGTLWTVWRVRKKQ